MKMIEDRILVDKLLPGYVTFGFLIRDRAPDIR